MQEKITGAKYEMYFDGSNQGDVIIRDIKSSHSVVVPCEDLIRIFTVDNSSNDSTESNQGMSLINFFKLNLIDKHAFIEIFQGSTSEMDCIFRGEIFDLLTMYNKEPEGNNYYQAIGNSNIYSIWNENSITKILLE